MGKNHNLRDKSKKFRQEHASKKKLLWVFQNGYCGCCGERMPHPDDQHYGRVELKMRPSEEHVWPLSKFPRRRSWGNIMLSHWKCNSSKQDRLPTGCELVWLTLVNMQYADHKRKETNEARRRSRAAKKTRKPTDPHAPGLTDEQLMAIFHNPVRRVDSPA